MWMHWKIRGFMWCTGRHWAGNWVLTGCDMWACVCLWLVIAAVNELRLDFKIGVWFCVSFSPPKAFKASMCTCWNIFWQPCSSTVWFEFVIPTLIMRQNVSIQTTKLKNKNHVHITQYASQSQEAPCHRPWQFSQSISDCGLWAGVYVERKHCSQPNHKTTFECETRELLLQYKDTPSHDKTASSEFHLLIYRIHG